MALTSLAKIYCSLMARTLNSAVVVPQIINCNHAQFPTDQNFTSCQRHLLHGTEIRAPKPALSIGTNMTMVVRRQVGRYENQLLFYLQWCVCVCVYIYIYISPHKLMAIVSVRGSKTKLALGITMCTCFLVTL